ncbi:MAG: FkbM family methyltransferase [Patescibacteria group bacterium]|nr:FkbM family methyltransferase [Patescibacteria group bacterium]
MDHIKSVLRSAVRLYCSVPIRGRFRLADIAGRILASHKPDHLQIGEISIPIDCGVEVYRYMAAGVYEDANVRHWRRVLRPGNVFIDGGANVGYMAAIAHSIVGPSGHVYAVEASPTCRRMLRHYLHADNITLIEAALADEVRQMRFYDTPRVVSRGFAALAAVETPNDGKPTMVDSITVDEIAQKYNIDTIRYLKLDIEGAEPLAIKGASRLLSEHRIDFIMVESSFCASDAKRSLEAASMLRQFGYSPYAISAFGNLMAVTADELNGRRLDLVWC